MGIGSSHRRDHAQKHETLLFEGVGPGDRKMRRTDASIDCCRSALGGVKRGFRRIPQKRIGIPLLPTPS